MEFIIQTGRSTREGSGVLTHDIGKEEVGIADITVENWLLVDSSSFESPLHSLNVASKMAAMSDVSASETG